MGAAEYHHQEGIDNVQLAGGRPSGTDHGKGATRHTGDATTQREGHPVNTTAVDTHRFCHWPVLYHGAYLAAPTGAVHEQINGKGNQQGQHHHENPVDWDFHKIGDGDGSHHPVRQADAHLTGTENGAIGLLQNQAQPPGRQ